MMRKSVVMVTGANGEVGRGLIDHLANQDDVSILALDIKALDDDLRAKVQDSITGDILDTNLLEYLMSEYEINTIFHLAALLSTRSEFTPEAAHRVNVGGTINLLHLAIEQSRWQGRSVKFLFPSSIAVYGIPNIQIKNALPPVAEDDHLMPVTMYGCNKLYCEHLGRYYAKHYRQLAGTPEPFAVDFRSLRFPGLISAHSMPSGGTSDFVPEMLHNAAQGEAYASFVRPDARIPFMVMPDAITSLLRLAQAPREALTRYVYNVTSFDLSAEETAGLTRAAFPDAQITFAADDKRQGIVDSWPAMLDDAAARNDWGWQPEYDRAQAFDDYLIPILRERYANPI
jgi:nucleoside-diphosphate-sugar epimerase